MQTSVSHLDLYRSWRDRNGDDEYPLSVLIQQLTSNTPTEDMLRGRAFARCMERAPELLETDTLSCDGYTFAFTGDFQIESYPRRESRAEKDYGGITVACRCDRLLGRAIIDDKSTTYFEAEKYIDNFQWRFYLDIFGADRFHWNFWECKALKEDHAYEVFAMHPIVQYRYPEMEHDCRLIALEFKKFAERWMPGYPYPRTSAVPLPPEFPMHATKGHNLVGVGWMDGVLRCEFSGSRFGRFSGVPEQVKDKLRRSPYPDKLFTQICKGIYPYTAEQEPSQREI